MPRRPCIPPFPSSIKKGVPLKSVLSEPSIRQLGMNIQYVQSDFPIESFTSCALDGLERLSLMERSRHIASSLQSHLSGRFSDDLQTLIASFTPKRTEVGDLGVSTFFYLPHSSFIAQYGIDHLAPSCQGLYELTTRFTSEFAIRPFLQKYPQEVLLQLSEWVFDPNPHVRRLASEGSRPTLPWGIKLPHFLNDPTLTFPILDVLQHDPERYVTRSVANHLGDLAKQHPDWVIIICKSWLDETPTKEMKWLVRHAVRYLAKKKHPDALRLRIEAK